jgi:hypothetical protein
MDLTDVIFRLTAKGSLGRTLPRTGGRAPAGVDFRLEMPADTNRMWVRTIDLPALGDSVSFDLTNGTGTPTAVAGVTIGGTTVPASAGQLVRAGASSGRHAYATVGAPANRTSVTWLGSYWTLQTRNAAGAVTGEWRSTSDVTNPWDATGWTAQGAATGTPTVAEWTRTLQAPAGGALDAEGLALDIEEIRMLIIRAEDVTSGADVGDFGVSLGGGAIPAYPLLAFASRTLAEDDLTGDPLILTAGLGGNQRFTVACFGFQS